MFDREVIFLDRRIENPILKAIMIPLIICLASVHLFLGLLLLGLALFIVILTSPIWISLYLIMFILTIPVHFILIVLGRRGFVNQSESGWSYNVNKEGFQKR